MRRTVIAMMSIAPCALVCAQGTYVIPLGDLPGSIFQSNANDISADGKIVVGESQSYGGFDGFQAFRWTAETGMVGLGELPGGRSTSLAGGISPDGRWISGYSNSGALGWESCVWTPGSTIVPTGRLAGYSLTAFSDISNNGVACGVAYPATSFPSRAVRWTSETGMVDLGTLGGAQTDSSRASGISADGRVIVGESSIGTGSYGFRWTEETGMVAMEPAKPGDFTYNIVEAISHNGKWASGHGNLGASIWDEAGKVYVLGQLRPGIASFAQAVSDDGRVVAGYGGFDAFIWTPSWGMRTLNSVMLDYGIDLVALRYDIVDITGISADGSTMCATGISPEGTQAFLIHIPAPGAYVMMLAAGVFACRRRR